VTPTADVVVSGGGIMGASIAFRLAERGLKVTLVEKTFVAAAPSTNRRLSFASITRTNSPRMALHSRRDDLKGHSVVDACDMKRSGR
jgi:glycine/D-amino acid oxidase-like deaminating enzyme